MNFLLYFRMKYVFFTELMITLRVLQVHCIVVHF